MPMCLVNGKSAACAALIPAHSLQSETAGKFAFSDVIELDIPTHLKQQGIVREAPTKMPVLLLDASQPLRRCVFAYQPPVGGVEPEVLRQKIKPPPDRPPEVPAIRQLEVSQVRRQRSRQRVQYEPVETVAAHARHLTD